MQLPTSLREIGKVKPDSIVHRRGQHNSSASDNNNLLIGEVKKNPRQQERESDIRKIEACMQEAPYIGPAVPGYFCSDSIDFIKNRAFRYQKW